MSTVEPVIAPDVALMLVVPVATPVARPWLPLVLLIVAMPVSDEAHVTDVVRFWVLPSLKVPVAVNCWVPPTPIEGFAGVTAKACNTRAGATVTVAVVLPPSVAVSVTVCDDDTVPAVAVNVVEVAAWGTVTDAGTGSAAVLFEAKVTVLPPLGAG